GYVKAVRPCQHRPCGCSAVIDRLRGAHRGALAVFLMPARDTGVISAPVLIAKPEIEIGQRATDRDMPNGEGRGEAGGLVFERLEHGQFLGAQGTENDWRGMRALTFVAQQQQEIEKPVA